PPLAWFSGYSYPIQLVFRNFTRNAIPPPRPGKPGGSGGGGKAMGGRKFGRSAAGVLGLAAAALVTWAAVSAAQFRDEPGRFPKGPSTPLPRETAEPPIAAPGLPPLITPVEDASVEPAQYTRPAGTPASPNNPPARQTVADPPSPVVKIQVRVPADSPPD